MSLLITPRAAFAGTAASAPRRSYLVQGRTASPAVADRSTLGILAILASTCCFPLSDLAAQSLMTALPPVEVAWLRYGVFFLLVMPLLLRGRASVLSQRPGLQVLRGAMTALSTLAALVSFKVLPVAETTAIGFVCPVFVTALAMVILKEAVGVRRWAAALVALAGVAIIVQPGAASFRPVALLPLFGAAAGAVAVICTRLCKGDDARVTVFYTTAVGALLLTLVAIPVAVMPTASQFAVLVVVGLFGAAGSVLQVVGYRLAPASLLAPFTSLQLVWASGLSFLLLGFTPRPAMVVGALVIAASAIYTGYRERARGVA